MAAMRKGVVRAVAIISVILFLRLCGLYPSADVFPLRSSSSSPANSTLGFGAIFAVSGRGSPRRDHLIQSANVTGIDLTIPEQPQWTGKDEDEFRAVGEAKMSSGSVFAWLSHDFTLKKYVSSRYLGASFITVCVWLGLLISVFVCRFLDSGLETALILEDDVDWDIHLRPVQIPAAAAAMRSHISSSSSSSSRSRSRSRDYYGDISQWDLLYIGHCGDYFDSVDYPVGVGHLSPADLTSLPHIMYNDPTLLSRWQLHPYTASFLTALNVPEKTRLVHKSVWPLCTFAYAVTRNGAQVLREQAAPPKATVGAFDIAIMHGCQHGLLRCVSVNPELFHHVEGDSLIGKSQEKSFRAPVDQVGLEQTTKRGETSNIGCGFWGSAFEFNGDLDRLAYLRREVGQKGRCLKNGRV